LFPIMPSQPASCLFANCTQLLLPDLISCFFFGPPCHIPRVFRHKLYDTRKSATISVICCEQAAE
jgi:hypothetical protein